MQFITFLFLIIVSLINIQVISGQYNSAQVYIISNTPTLYGSLCSYEISFVSNVSFSNIYGTQLNSWSVSNDNPKIYTTELTTNLGVYNLFVGAIGDDGEYSFKLATVNCTNLCPGLNNPCNGNGECVFGQCKCFSPYTGPDCFNQLPTSNPSCPSCNCGSHGTCNYTDPSLPTCDCDYGYSGELCNIEVPTPNDNFINSLIFLQENQSNGKPVSRRFFNNWDKRVEQEYNGVYYYYNTSIQVGQYTPSFQIKVVDFYNMYTGYSNSGALQVESSFNFELVIRNYPFSDPTNTLQLLFNTQIKDGCMGIKKTLLGYSEESFLTIQIPNSQSSFLFALVDLLSFSC